MKESIRTLAPQFSTCRMVKEYIEHMYVPAIQGQKIPDSLAASSASSPAISSSASSAADIAR